MQNTHYEKIYWRWGIVFVIAGILLSLLSIAKIVEAELLLLFQYQTTDTTTGNLALNNASEPMLQQLGSPTLDGEIQEVYVKYYANIPGGHASQGADFNIYYFTTSSTTQYAQYNSFTSVTGATLCTSATATNATWSAGESAIKTASKTYTTCPADTDKTYYIRYNNTTGSDNKYAIGASTNTYFKGAFNTADTSVVDAYQVITAVSTTTPETTTRIIYPTSPASGTLATSTTVFFDYDYYINDEDVTNTPVATIELLDITNGIVTLVPISFPINTGGYGNYTGVMTLTDGHIYSWKPKLENQDNTIILGQTSILTIQSGATYNSLFPTVPFEPGTVAEATTSLNEAVGIMGGFYTMILTKHPFAWVLSLYNLFQDIRQDSATTSQALVDLDFAEIPWSGNFATSSGTSSLAGLHIEIASTTVTNALGSTLLGLMRGLLIAVLYVLLAFGLFTRIKNAF